MRKCARSSVTSVYHLLSDHLVFTQSLRTRASLSFDLFNSLSLMRRKVKSLHSSTLELTNQEPDYVRKPIAIAEHLQ